MYARCKEISPQGANLQHAAVPSACCWTTSINMSVYLYPFTLALGANHGRPSAMCFNALLSLSLALSRLSHSLMIHSALPSFDSGINKLYLLSFHHRPAWLKYILCVHAHTFLRCSFVLVPLVNDQLFTNFFFHPTNHALFLFFIHHRRVKIHHRRKISSTTNPRRRILIPTGSRLFQTLTSPIRR